MKKMKLTFQVPVQTVKSLLAEFIAEKIETPITEEDVLELTIVSNEDGSLYAINVLADVEEDEE